MAVAVDKYIGNTHIVIDDAECAKTPEEVQAIMETLGRIFYDSAMRRAIEAAAEHKEA